MSAFILFCIRPTTLLDGYWGGRERMHGISNMTNIHMIADGTIKGHKKHK